MNGNYPFSLQGLIISQPFGDFFVAPISARVLMEVAYSDRLTAVRQVNGSYKVEGSQRKLAERRLKEIGEFIGTPTAAFPNSIILAANYREDDGLIEERDELKWSISPDEGGTTGTLSSNERKAGAYYRRPAQTFRIQLRRARKARYATVMRSIF